MRSKSEKSFERRLRRHLSPLVGMPYSEILLFLDKASRAKLKALDRVIGETSSSNCCWMEFDFAKRFGVDVARMAAEPDRKRRRV